MAGTDRRQQIIKAAAQLAVEGGIDSVSVRAVAARAGIGASTLRHYFPTQAALYDAVLEPALDLLVSDKRIGDRRVRPQRRLTECLMQFLPGGQEGHLAGMSNEQALDQWFGLYVTALGPQRTEGGRAALTWLSTRLSGSVRGWLTTLDEEGVLAVPVEDALRLLLAVVDGICLQVMTPDGPLRVDSVEPTLSLAVERVIVG